MNFKKALSLAFFTNILSQTEKKVQKKTGHKSTGLLTEAEIILFGRHRVGWRRI